MTSITVIMSFIAVGAIFWTSIELTSLFGKQKEVSETASQTYLNMKSNSLIFHKH